MSLARGPFYLDAFFRNSYNILLLNLKAGTKSPKWEIAVWYLTSTKLVIASRPVRNARIKTKTGSKKPNKLQLQWTAHSRCITARIWLR